MRNQEKKTFWDRLTYKYQLIIRNEENFAEKTTLTFNYAKVLSLFIIFFACSVAVSLFIGKYILTSFYDPEHDANQRRKEVTRLAVAVDSLEHLSVQKDAYIEQFRLMLEGGVPQSAIEEGEASAESPAETPEVVTPASNPVEEPYVQGGGAKIVKTSYRKGNDLSDIFYFPPLSGYEMTAKFEPKIRHFGVDIVAGKNEPISTIADGMVILSSWTEDAGNVVAIQHENNIISIYKHNSVLLQQVGNFVRAGDIIAIIGNSGELTNGPHLHFELWQDGNPLDPENFISF